VQEHEHIFIVGFGGKPGGIGRFDGAAETPPEIQFPTNVEARAVLPETLALRILSARFPTIAVQNLAAGHLRLRVAPALGDAQLGAGLHHSQAGNLHACVVSIGFGNQMVEGWVSEHLPPLTGVGLWPGLAGLLESWGAPVFDPGVMPWLEVRPHTHAATEAECADQQ
jgi:hypothetical protein